MTEQLIGYATAKLAASAGFKSISKLSYDKDGNILTPHFGDFFTNGEENGICLYEAPTQSLLQKWLREKHKIHIEISYIDEVANYKVIVTTIEDNTEICERAHIHIYEDALEIGLNYALFHILELQETLKLT